MSKISSFVMYMGFIFTPMIYLCLHGWASKNLIDTTIFDSIAKFLFIISMIGALISYFIFLEGK